MGNTKRYELSSGVRAAKALAIARLAGAALNLLVQLVLIRVLASEDYAVFLLSASFATVLAVSTMLGVDRVVYRHVPALISVGQHRAILLLFSLFLSVRAVQTIVMFAIIALVPGAWLPYLFNDTLANYAWPVAFYCAALSTTDSLAIYASSLGLQKRSSIASLFATLTRALVILLVLFIGTSVALLHLLWWFVATEIVYALALTGILATEFHQFRTSRQHTKAQQQLAKRKLLVEGFETQVSYLLRLPFLGSSIRLLVASFAGPAAIAAFGFFQTLADRLYQFLPLVLFKGIVEPGLSADYQKNGDPQRIATVLSLLLRINLAVLIPAIVFLLAGQSSLATLLAGARYETYWHFAPLAILLIVAQLASEMLWTGLNPMGEANAVNRYWRWSSAGGLIILGGAIYLRSVEAVVFACIFPNIVVIAWLRYQHRHPLLLSHWSLDGSFAIIKAAALASAPIFAAQLLGYGLVPVLAALVLGSLIYVLLLKRFGLFASTEVQAIAEVAPGAARMFLIFARRKSA